MARLDRQGEGSVFAERQVIAWPVALRSANDAGKSVMFKCQSWSLTEMSSIYLSGDNRRRDVDNEAALLKTWATHQGRPDGLALPTWKPTPTSSRPLRSRSRSCSLDEGC